MKQFIWNWKFKFSLFSKKEKMLFKIGLVLMTGSVVITSFILRPVYYDVEFYGSDNNFIVSYEVTKGTEIKLSDYSPSSDLDAFYGWSNDPESTTKLTSITINNDEKFYGIWGEYKEVVDKEYIDYSEISKEDDSIYKGESVTSQEGAKGVREVIRNVFVVAGVEVHSETIEKRVTEEPQDKIVLVGTKEKEDKVVSKPKDNISGNQGNEGDPVPETKKPTDKVDTPTQKEENSGQKEEIPSQETPNEEIVYEYGIKVIPNSYNDKFKNCTDLRTIYSVGVPKGHPAYEKYPGGDRDKDGWACEGPGTPGSYYEANN